MHARSEELCHSLPRRRRKRWKKNRVADLQLQVGFVHVSTSTTANPRGTERDRARRYGPPPQRVMPLRHLVADLPSAPGRIWLRFRLVRELLWPMWRSSLPSVSPSSTSPTITSLLTMWCSEASLGRSVVRRSPCRQLGDCVTPLHSQRPLPCYRLHRSARSRAPAVDDPA